MSLAISSMLAGRSVSLTARVSTEIQLRGELVVLRKAFGFDCGGVY
jgi:hypothetical protein